MKEIKLFKNYGCLAAEKRVMYTYGATAGTATCADEFTVIIPDGYTASKTVFDNIVVTTPTGLEYLINDILSGNKYPHFMYYDGSRTVRVKLDVASNDR